MFRKLALAGTISLVLAGPAWAANAPTYQDPVGQTRDAQGVVVVNPDGTIGPGATGGLSQSDFDAKVGEVQATPTANTLLRRLKDLLTLIVLSAGENHVGEVGNNEITIGVAQTVTASSAYTAGNAVGGLITFSGATRVSGSSGAAGTSGLAQSAVVNSKSAQTTQMDLVLFNANPTGSTCTDKTAIAVAAADFDKVLGVAHVIDWTALGTPSVGQAQNLAIPYALTSSTTLYGCLVTRSTPTFTATTDISISLRLIRN